MQHSEIHGTVGGPCRVILIGPPGAGKGTQASALSCHLGVPHISTGDIFRRNVGENTDLGAQAKSYMDAGELVPDELTVAMVRDRLSDEDALNGFLLDGFPRNVDQAVFLGEWLVRTETALDAVLEMRVPDEEIVRRLSGRRTCGECGQISHVDITPTARYATCDACGGALHQRDDDTETSIRRRLEIYHQQTAPLTAFFDDRGFLVSIDATGPVGAVTRRATTALAGRESPTAF